MENDNEVVLKAGMIGWVATWFWNAMAEKLQNSNDVSNEVTLIAPSYSGKAWKVSIDDTSRDGLPYTREVWVPTKAIVVDRIEHRKERALYETRLAQITNYINKREAKKGYAFFAKMGLSQDDFAVGTGRATYLPKL